MVEVVTAGRADIDAFFEGSGIRRWAPLKFHPLLVFVPEESKVTVEILTSAAELLKYPDEYWVMAQWGGEWRSDFFHFTVGQFRRYVAEHPKKEHWVV